MRLSSVCYLNEPKDCSVCIHCSGELRTYNISEVLFGLWPVEMIPIRMAPWYHIGLPHQYCQMYCIFYLASLESCKVNGSGWQINTSCITCLFSFLQLPHSFLQHGGSDMKWVDGGKPLFKVSTFVVSTVNTQDPHVNAFFRQCQKREKDMSQSPTSNFIRSCKNLLNVEKIHAIMSFLPIILNQLFKVLVQNEEDEISTTVTRYVSHGLRRRDLTVCDCTKLWW